VSVRKGNIITYMLRVKEGKVKLHVRMEGDDEHPRQVVLPGHEWQAKGILTCLIVAPRDGQMVLSLGPSRWTSKKHVVAYMIGLTIKLSIPSWHLPPNRHLPAHHPTEGDDTDDHKDHPDDDTDDRGRRHGRLHCCIAVGKHKEKESEHKERKCEHGQ